MLFGDASGSAQANIGKAEVRKSGEEERKLPLRLRSSALPDFLTS
jgi:hypothetical protein